LEGCEVGCIEGCEVGFIEGCEVGNVVAITGDIKLLIASANTIK
jgi:hypothetical protein